ncbi:hypothetical protein SEA_GUANICA15_74 [Mycobacterium phage Guanica15]|uniref:Uncharacterized protein n=1 Tax=Mycobacterium phage Yunkel11 TaxID=2599886 RepID=A0A5J6TDM4_9CAUD|nr:hypothetical protein I5H09_gp032 [Mycobacterium phage Yunkel11]QFG08488.1 hypothetical protein SEA_YUNKEL11_74 [Mycobacterium phage Yunkel11]QFG11711.1 hypothetical protein SEA_GUANICA15_74 [Mycobacterium phage Guanica15]
MLRWPSRASAPANGMNLYSMRTAAVQVVQISTGRFNRSVLTLPQVKAYKKAFSTSSTDVFGLTSRVEIRGVSAGRLTPGAVCGAHMGKPVLLVLPPVAVNPSARRAVAGAWRGADRRR